jgi:hypothetical protein
VIDDDLPVCPDGTTYNATLNFCASNSHAFGPFPTAMVDACKQLNGGESCTKKIAAQVQGRTLYLPKWALDLTNKVRGVDECPVGTIMDQNALGECVEYIGDSVAGYTDMAVFGGIPATAGEICEAATGGDSCFTNRWNSKYYVSITNPGFGIAATNDTDDTCTYEEGCESGNDQIEEQKEYSDDVSSECSGVCSPAEIAAISVSAGVIAGVVIGGAAFIGLTSFASKKGYDLYTKRKSVGMPSAPENALYRDSGRTGNNPMYSAQSAHSVL